MPFVFLECSLVSNFVLSNKEDSNVIRYSGFVHIYWCGKIINCANVRVRWKLTAQPMGVVLGF